MKQIGTTNTHDIIVEMTQTEYDALRALALAIEGKTPNQIRMYQYTLRSTGDLSTVLNAIHAFATNISLINELRAILDDAHDSILSREQQQKK